MWWSRASGSALLFLQSFRTANGYFPYWGVGNTALFWFSSVQHNTNITTCKSSWWNIQTGRSLCFSFLILHGRYGLVVVNNILNCRRSRRSTIQSPFILFKCRPLVVSAIHLTLQPVRESLLRWRLHQDTASVWRLRCNDVSHWCWPSCWPGSYISGSPTLLKSQKCLSLTAAASCILLLGATCWRRDFSWETPLRYFAPRVDWR